MYYIYMHYSSRHSDYVLCYSFSVFVFPTPSFLSDYISLHSLADFHNFILFKFLISTLYLTLL